MFHLGHDQTPHAVSGGIISGSPCHPVDFIDMHQHFWNFFQQHFIASPTRNIQTSSPGPDEYPYGGHVCLHRPVAICHYPNDNDTGSVHRHHFCAGPDQRILRNQKPSLFQTTETRKTRSLTVLKKQKGSNLKRFELTMTAWAMKSMLFLTVDGVRCDERFGHNLLIQYHFHIHFRLFPPQIQNFGLDFYVAFDLNRF